MVLPTVLTDILSAHGRLGDAAWHYTEHARHVGPKKLQAAFAQSFTARFLHTGLKLETSWGLGSVGVQPPVARHVLHRFGSERLEDALAPG